MKGNFTVLAVLVSCIYFLSGCRSSGGVVDPVPEQPRIAPVEALQLCPALDVSLGHAGLADLARALQEVAEEYHMCSGRHKQLVEWYERQKK